MYQQNNSQLAVLPRRSRRLATIIPASHWISMGYSESDAQLMEKLQNDIKKYCDNSGDIDIDLRGREDVGELPHHDMMVPHWKKLFKALQGRTNVEFHITGISLPTSLLDIAFPALHSVNILKLTIFGADLGGEGFQCLSSYIGNNSSLTSFGVGADQLDDLSVATALSNALKNHPTLKEVFIGDCAFHASVFEKILEGCTRKKCLTLTFVDFNSDGIGVMADFISSNHPIEKLHLKDINIADNDTKLLVLALKTNTRLKELDLRENNEIAEEGEKAILKAMFDQTSLDSIVESNHTCKAYTKDHYEGLLSIVGFTLNPSIVSVPRPRFYLEREALYINGLNISTRKKIRKKVVLALCGVDGDLFDLSHFNDLPLGVMPRVLELIQDHATTRMRMANICLEKDALSRLFHTLRGWELPSLFVNLNTPSANATTGRRKRRKTRR